MTSVPLPTSDAGREHASYGKTRKNHDHSSRRRSRTKAAQQQEKETVKRRGTGHDPGLNDSYSSRNGLWITGRCLNERNGLFSAVEVTSTTWTLQFGDKT
jgi:hypothetical protein